MWALEYLVYKHASPRAAGRTREYKLQKCKARASPMGILNHGSFLNGVRIWLAFRIIKLYRKLPRDVTL